MILTCTCNLFVFFVCTILCVVFPQAPGACDWRDVQRLVVNGSEGSFHDYAKSLCVKGLSHHEGVGENFCTELITCVEANWKASVRYGRHDNERQLQPVVHSMLYCAAQAAQNRSREYFVVSEPSVYQSRADRVSDEAVMEAISEGDVIRILLEVKGSHVFPRCFYQAGQQVFSQLIQQVALALKSNLWKKEILSGIVTRDEWLMFRIVDKSLDNGRMQLHIQESTSILLQDPSVHPMPMHSCLTFLTDYLRRNP